MKILVTGGNGQLGSALNKVIANSRHQAVFTDMPEADITNIDCMQDLVEKHEPDLIVNCAAYTAVDKAEAESDLAARINTEGTKVLACVAKNNDIALIHISTDYVFDGKSCTPLHEDHLTAPSGVYGKTKLDGEAALISSGCRAAIIRTAWLYSEFGNNFVKTMLRLAKERDELSVVYDQVGTPTYAPDLAEAILSLAESGISGCEIYHFSNEGVTSWYDFAKTIFALESINIRLKPVESDQFPTPAKRPAYSVLSKQKIKQKGIAIPYWVDSLMKCLQELKS